MQTNRPDNSDRAWEWIRHFLEVYLPKHRGASPHTCESYKMAFRLFRRFLQERNDRSTASLSLGELEAGLLLDYLEWLEGPEGANVSASTRNCRLAAWKSLFRYLELHCPLEHIEHWRRLRELPFKKAAKPTTEYLEPFEVEAVFAAVSLQAPDGIRDATMLAFLYNTGARASEVADLRRSWLLLDDRPVVRIAGKGRRTRVCPLWTSTASLLAKYLEEHRRHPKPGSEPYVFINQRRTRMTRHGVRRVVEKYVREAAAQNPSIKLKRLSTHSFRHTTAIHLLETGAEVNVIKAWLGHSSTRSTSRYLNLDLGRQRALLESFTSPPTLENWSTDFPNEQQNDIKQWLEEL